MKADFGNFDLAGDGAPATPDASGVARPPVRPPVWQWLLGAALALMLVEVVLKLRRKII